MSTNNSTAEQAESMTGEPMKQKNILKKFVHDRKFTIIDNSFLQNKNLSFKAKGIGSLLLSLPDDWVITQRGMAHFAKDGLDSVGSGFRELKEQGFLETRVIRNDRGQIDYWVTYFREDLSIRDLGGNPKRIRIFGGLSSGNENKFAQFFQSLSKVDSLVIDMSNFVGMGTSLLPLFTRLFKT